MAYSEDRRYVGRRTEDALDGWVDGLMASMPVAAAPAPAPAAQADALNAVTPVTAPAPQVQQQDATVQSLDAHQQVDAAPQSLPTERQ